MKGLVYKKMTFSVKKWKIVQIFLMEPKMRSLFAFALYSGVLVIIYSGCVLKEEYREPPLIKVEEDKEIKVVEKTPVKKEIVRKKQWIVKIYEDGAKISETIYISGNFNNAKLEQCIWKDEQGLEHYVSWHDKIRIHHDEVFIGEEITH